MDEMVMQLVHPFALFICGPAKIGKSTLTKEIIMRRKECIHGDLKHIVYVAGEPSSIHGLQHPDIRFIPAWDDTYLRPDTLVVFDDMGQEFSKSMNNFITGKKVKES